MTYRETVRTVAQRAVKEFERLWHPGVKLTTAEQMQAFAMHVVRTTRDADAGAVGNAAANLRDILNAHDEGPADPLALADELRDAARALLAAIGEGE